MFGDDPVTNANRRTAKAFGNVNKGMMNMLVGPSVFNPQEQNQNLDERIQQRMRELPQQRFLNRKNLINRKAENERIRRGLLKELARRRM